MKINNFQLGCDFELFLYDKNKQEVINAKKYVKGSKDKPFNFDKSNPFWCTSLDNISMEGNIPPCTSSNDFSDSIEKVILYMNSKLPSNLTTIHDPAVRVNEEYLRTKEARTFGCMSTLNGYTLQENPPPSGETTTLRTCCTHIHLSFDNMNIDTASDWVKACDLFLGVPSLLIEPKNERRELYGIAGEMRYGKTAEYRVLSSYFSQTKVLRKWCFDNAVKAIDFVNNDFNLNKQMENLIQSTITNNDVMSAKKLVKKYNIPMPI